MNLLLVGGSHNGRVIDFEPLPCIYMQKPVKVNAVAYVADDGKLPPLSSLEDTTERYYGVRPRDGLTQRYIYLVEERYREYNRLLLEVGTKRNEAARWARDADELHSTLMASIASNCLVEARICEEKARRLLNPDNMDPSSKGGS